MLERSGCNMSVSKVAMTLAVLSSALSISLAGSFYPTTAKDIGSLEEMERFLKETEYHTVILLQLYSSRNCRACVSIQDQVENLSRYFNTMKTVHHTNGEASDRAREYSSVFARVDCGKNEEAKKVCKYLNVNSYPKFLTGLPSEFWEEMHFSEYVQLNSDKKFRNEMNEYFHHVTPLDYQWLFNSSDTLSATKGKASAVGYTVLSSTVFMSDMLKGAQETLKYIALDEDILKSSKAREAFILYQEWIKNAHVGSTCRTGAKNILKWIDEIWPEKAENITEIQENFQTVQQCPGNPEYEEYEGCEDYYCALWQNLHGMTVRISEDYDPLNAMEAFKGFLKYLMPNEKYRKESHLLLLGMLMRETHGDDMEKNMAFITKNAIADVAAKAMTRDDLIIIVWHLHLLISYKTYDKRYDDVHRKERLLQPFYPPHVR